MVITRVAAKDQWNNPHKTNKAHYHSYTRSVCIHTRHRILNTETTSRDQLRSPRNNNTSMPRAIVGRVPCYWCWVQGAGFEPTWALPPTRPFRRRKERSKNHFPRGNGLFVKFCDIRGDIVTDACNWCRFSGFLWRFVIKKVTRLHDVTVLFMSGTFCDNHIFLHMSTFTSCLECYIGATCVITQAHNVEFVIVNTI